MNKEIKDAELKAVTGGTTEEELNGTFYVKPISEVTPFIIGGHRAERRALTDAQRLDFSRPPRSLTSQGTEGAARR